MAVDDHLLGLLKARESEAAKLLSRLKLKKGAPPPVWKAIRDIPAGEFDTTLAGELSALKESWNGQPGDFGALEDKVSVVVTKAQVRWRDRVLKAAGIEIEGKPQLYPLQGMEQGVGRLAASPRKLGSPNVTDLGSHSVVKVIQGGLREWRQTEWNSFNTQLLREENGRFVKPVWNQDDANAGETDKKRLHYYVDPELQVLLRKKYEAAEAICTFMKTEWEPPLRERIHIALIGGLDGVHTVPQELFCSLPVGKTTVNAMRASDLFVHLVWGKDGDDRAIRKNLALFAFPRELNEMPAHLDALDMRQASIILRSMDKGGNP